jgi:hypothetical protein
VNNLIERRISSICLREYILFCVPKFPAHSSACVASLGRFVSITDAAIVSGTSAVSSPSGILSLPSGDVDILIKRGPSVLDRKSGEKEGTI